MSSSVKSKPTGLTGNPVNKVTFMTSTKTVKPPVRFSVEESKGIGRKLAGISDSSSDHNILRASDSSGAEGNDDEDVSSGWSAQDSIDREIKEMRKADRRKERKKAKKLPPQKMMIEKELKKGELLG